MKPSARWLVPCLVGVVLGWGLRSSFELPVRAQPDKPPEANPQERALDANLYVQTAGEYRACCLTIYRCATERLRQLRALFKDSPLPSAVVLDLDETVFDNSAFQSFLTREKLPYSDRLWDDWEKNYPREVRLVPGAKAFIEEAERLDVRVVYISNRLEEFRASTVEALKANGLNTDDIDERLFLKADSKPPSSNKSARRDRVQARYRVLLYLGDQLRDFAEVFVAPEGIRDRDNAAQLKAIEERLGKVDESGGHFGVDWFVLPNPVYGEWTKFLGKDPLGKFRPTSMKRP